MLLLVDDLLLPAVRMSVVPERPALAPWFRAAGDEQRLVFEHAHRAVVLEGAAVQALLPRLLPLLDGSRSVDELAGRLELPRAVLDHTLGVLAARGLLVAGPAPDVEPALLSVAEQIAAACGPPPEQVAAALADASVAVAGESRTADEVERLFAAVGLETRRVVLGEPVAGDLLVAAPSRDELPRLRVVNAQALRAALAWLHVLPFDGRIAAVGPLVLPGETACWSCYALRRGASLGFGDVAELLEDVPPAAPAGAVLETLAATTAVAVALRWLGARDPRLPGVLHAVEAQADLRITLHHVLRVPRCPACSQAPLRARPAPWFDPLPAEVA